MANTESDATYCSEVEKQNLSQRRRSQRLSQKVVRSFRSNEDPAFQRFEDIHQMLKNNTVWNGWSKHDWLALRIEVGLIKKSLKGVARTRITLVEKKISQHLRQSSTILTSNVAVECQNDHNEDAQCEPVKSPNILAGMTTEVLTELPPYQPHNMLNIVNTVKSPIPSIAATQIHPIDLRKRGLEARSDVRFSKESVHIERPLESNITEKDKNSKPAAKDVSKDSMIDLTDDIIVEADQEIPAPIVEAKPISSKPEIHKSKWLKYLPIQQKPKALSERPKVLSPLKDKPKSFKQSLIRLYKDHSNSTTNIPDKAKKSTLRRSPSKPKTGPKPSKSRCNESSKQKPLRNTESALEHDFELADLQPRTVQSDRIPSLSPDFFADDLIQLDLVDLNDCDSETSLPLSLKNSFKKVFGTDSLDDVLGCEKVIYSLMERHVGRLASALNVEHDSLKRTIEQILAEDGALVEDDRGSGSSVVECSQSPPHRLFPSQRSQASK